MKDPNLEKRCDSLPLGDPEKGLSAAEANKRKEGGFHNGYNAKTGKSYGEIFKSNICQFFNFVLYGIVVLFLVFSLVLRMNGHADIATKYFGFSKFLFVGPATINIILSIVQECRSKKVLDKLRLVAESRITVIRDGEKQRIRSADVVYGDLLEVVVGEECPVDMKILHGKAEADESMLTGESEPVVKEARGGRDFAYAGSVLMSGQILGLAIGVGENTYANQLSKKVKTIEKTKSELMRSIYRVINVMAIVLLSMLILVLGTMMIKILLHGNDPAVFGNNPMSLSSPGTWAEITVTAAAFAIGVLPTGLVLVTSLSLAASVLILAREKTLIQELYSLENLSRVDTICLDKTGTLTDGTMSVENVVYFQDEEFSKKYLSTLVSSMKTLNQTGQAMLAYFGNEAFFKVKKDIPFSSARKYSGAELEDGKKLLLGAPEYLTEDPKILQQADAFAKEGKRVLLFREEETPVALIILKDGIRASAPETIAFFVENNVDIKIISGDNVSTVSKIASICGVPNADKAISLEGVELEKIPSLAEEYVIFGRVSPEQKEALVEALQHRGRKVAMTGDGVNDLLALRKANSSITFEKATDAAKSCADVVLLDNDFAHLKEVVSQGRKVVNNAQRSSVLFLMKTVCVVLLSLFLIPFPRGHMAFSIENIYLVQTSVIAIGGLLLSLEPTKKPIQGTYRQNVYPKALTAGVALLLGALLPCLLNAFQIITIENTTTLISVLTTFAGLAVLIRYSMPFTKYRVVVLIVVLVTILFLSLALPNTYLGGKPTSSADILSGKFAYEFFQPWNSVTVRGFFDQTSTWLTALIYAVTVYPQVWALEYVFEHIGHRLTRRLEIAERLKEREEKKRRIKEAKAKSDAQEKS